LLHLTLTLNTIEKLQELRMLKNLYVATNAPRSGKSLISLGIMEILSRRVERLGFFRPVIRQTQAPDNDIELMRQRYQLQVPYESLYGMSMDEVRSLISQGKSQEVLPRIFTRYKELEQHCDFILCEGSDLTGLATALEFDLNAQMANQIDAPVVVVFTTKMDARHPGLCPAGGRNPQQTDDRSRGAGPGCQTPLRNPRQPESPGSRLQGGGLGSIQFSPPD
jgi:hypothetical protein